MGGIGESLKSAREAKGITLDQVEEDTKIRKRYLQALEDGEYDIIPGRVYAKGFLRNYANYLGLDQEEVILEYKLLGVPVKEEYKQLDIETSINKRKRSAGRADKKTYLATVLIAVFAVMVLVVYSFAFRNTSKDNTNEAANQPNTEQSDRSKQPAKSSNKPAGQSQVKKPEAKTDAGQPQNGGTTGNGADSAASPGGAGTTGTTGADGSTGIPAGGANLTLKGQNAVCWLRVTVDGVVKFTGNLNPSETKTFSGTRKIVVRAGNAGAVEAVFNGQNMGKLGEIGQPETKEFTAVNPTGGSTSSTAVGGISGGQSASEGQQ